MPASAMCELSQGSSLSDQEVQALFARYLPLQSLPPDMAARINRRIMREVNVRLRRKLFVWSIADLCLSWCWRDRRGKSRF